MKFAFRKLRYIHWRDIGDFFLIFLSFIPGMVLKLFRPNIWLVTERKNDAHDNGYWLFKYIRENHPEKPVYYCISFDCKDYRERIEPLGNAIRYGSFRHHIYFWACKKYISAHIGDGFPAPFMCRLFLMNGFYFFKVYFLQHGVTKDIPPYLMKEANKIDVFITSAEREQEAVIRDLHYAPEQVVCTGMCRFDNLANAKTVPGRILIMPTWRWWLQPEHGKSAESIVEDIRNSNYYKNLMTLFTHPALQRLAEEHKLELIYFPHNQMQPFLGMFREVCPQITCASYGDYDVQQALMDSALLITDYSSIYFDFAYMKKPVIYYQPDYEEFCRRHYPEGYFHYETDGFGPVCKNAEEVVTELKNALENGLKMPQKYKDRVDGFFAYRDTDNTKRNYEYIKEHKI